MEPTLEQLTQYYQAGLDILGGPSEAARFLGDLQGATMALLDTMGKIGPDNPEKELMVGIFERYIGDPKYHDDLVMFGMTFGAILIGAAALEEKR